MAAAAAAATTLANEWHVLRSAANVELGDIELEDEMGCCRIELTNEDAPVVLVVPIAREASFDKLEPENGSCAYSIALIPDGSLNIQACLECGFCVFVGELCCCIDDCVVGDDDCFR